MLGLDADALIQIFCAFSILCSVVGAIANRLWLGRGFGVRAIQFVVAASIVPAVLILSVRGSIGGETSVAILGALVGYLFARISEFDESK